MTTAFIRTEMLPEQDPPASEVGLIGLIQKNLFNGWLNTILTLCSLAAITYILAGLIPWMFKFKN